MPAVQFLFTNLHVRQLMKHHSSPWLSLLIVLTAPLLSVIDVFIVNVAIPAIKSGVHASDGQVQLVIAGYLLGYASFLITGGRAGDHFGRKKVFFWGMFSFTLFSCFCGLAQTALQLNLTRFFQGISASFMVPQSIALIQVLFSDQKERGKAIGWFGITLGLASITGQVLGGYFSGIHFLVDGWRLIFLVNLPIGLAALWATHHFLGETEKSESNAFDYSGIAILTACLFCLIIPLIEGREAGWPFWSFMLLALSAIIFTYFIYDQKKKLAKDLNPLINITLFHNKGFNISLIAVLFQFMMHNAYLLSSAVFFQEGLHKTALTSGLCYIMPGLMFTISSVWAGKVIHRFGKRIPQIGGLVMIAAFALQIIYFKPGVTNPVIFVLMGIYGFGNGLVLPSLLNMALRGVPPQFAGAAAGVYSTFQQTASALGVSVIGGIFFYIAENGRSGPDYLKAFDQTTIVNIGCLCLTGIMLVVLPKPAGRVTTTIIAE
jgi:EmrB/QacA subfamily drug resistance transporter